ncbi:hypothetical protein AUEXF2481DRAFT_680239 [Aureobasidium subglaciale EXF-2481]|uniref:Uncharacterized protein n=1 Tax=Aureobasidium subglaciale (strain EXF-2481) TaxID=1043005 RepID=A0A074YNM0_AURSE|nr:uncharacterized protein AUEXF2481DRAFT_680239 [Aureobasidium subglaciale EXF-2481]KAI5199321.1 hypothetical protein E4T38_07093 [Aureobasidium subglaciale]KAI5218249.1 hypothetical protein E4T40_07024 [Aureobasidium subglaciale]KAI5221680.1 hypothetical protein E4T41_06944 [Aureobasidium subglaciale]KAI5259133.1 hypothetical protein E4T46_06922 [Aureobasidium subglaciale]KEQ95652.1 hypothetical protein AUEXF2481DRAFT_680239 [Aureobasidium subglaciale EXF-2481]
MCWKVETKVRCGICRKEAVVSTVHLGCHLDAVDMDSRGTCAEDITSEISGSHPCNSCVFETDDGGPADDRYPEPSDHPGFDQPKLALEVGRVPLPEPTVYKTHRKIENLAGAADELPSYDEAVSTPDPPSYVLTWVRHAETDVADIASNFATYRHRGLAAVARKRKAQIFELQRMLEDKSSKAAKLLDFAYETIESFLAEHEQMMLRIIHLRKQLEAVQTEIAFEGSSYPSPSQMALLEHRRDAILRALEGCAELNHLPDNTFVSPAVWDSRLGKLLAHVRAEMEKANNSGSE